MFSFAKTKLKPPTLPVGWGMIVCLSLASIANAQPSALPDLVAVPGSPAEVSGTSLDVLGKLPAAAPQAKQAANPGQTRPTPLYGMPSGLGFDGAQDAVDTERVVFRRAPIRIVLPIGTERMISFPGPVAFHAPEGFESLVQGSIIERTAYLKALAPFGTLRVVAEDLSDGRQIPIDFVSEGKSKGALSAVEVMLPGQGSAGRGPNQEIASAARAGSPKEAQRESAPMDMVALTRYAAQSLYAPKRLVPSAPGVRQLPIATVPVEGLYRGWRVQTTPIGSWRSGQLYVTAVRFTNQGQAALDIDPQEIRGHWLAATAQHTRLLAKGNDWDTTTVYLVCDRPFDACR